MPKRNTATNDKERHVLSVNFKDGTLAELPWDVLRDACPCAECIDKHGKRDQNPLMLTVTPNKTLVGVETAGNYAVQLIWGDGHRFGIYTWNYLRELAEKLATPKA